MVIRTGVQLYSVREALKEDAPGTLRNVMELGYLELEAGTGTADTEDVLGLGMSAEALKDLLDEYGATLTGTHIRPLNADTAPGVFRYCRTIGCRDLAVPIEFFRDEADLEAKCRTFNEIGKMCEAEGFRYLYHNHFHEFQKTAGETILDVIAESTDPRYVNLELDTFWALRAGLNPVQVLHHYGSRIKRIHLKDYAMPAHTNGPVNLLEKVHNEDFISPGQFSGVVAPTDFVEIGTGRIDIQAIVDATQESGSVDVAILEQDHSAYDALESLRISMEGLKKIRGLTF